MPRLRRSTVGAIVAALVVVSAAVGCASDESGGAADRRTVQVDASRRVPGSTVEDWVSYGDAVVLATATHERELEPGADEIELGEGLVGREVELHVDEILWTRSGAPAAPPTLTIAAPGWAFEGEERLEMVIEGFDRMAVGRRYLIPIVRYPDTGWGVLSTVTQVEGSSAMVRRDARTPEPVPLDGDPRPSEGALSAFAGQPVDEIAQLLAETEPDPIAAAHFDLDPLARWQAVGAQLDAAPTTTTT